VAGNLEPDEVFELANKWFRPIPHREIEKKSIKAEPQQKEHRKKTVQKEVPHNVLYKAFHMVSRNHEDFAASDLISDLLSNGKSARLYQQLVKKKQIFSNIDAYITGDADPGLLLISGAVSEDISIKKAEEQLNKELDKLVREKVDEEELQKVKNKVEAVHEFSKTSALHKAMNMSFYELLGDAERINTEIEEYRKVAPEDIKRVSNYVLNETNCSTLYYQKK
jgi:predicted Zn-dependent peptidase